MAEKMTLNQAAALCVRVGNLLRHGAKIDKLLIGNLLLQAALVIDEADKKEDKKNG